jgi:hypothetical protein
VPVRRITSVCTVWSIDLFQCLFLMLSSRERRPGTAGNNNRNVARSSARLRNNSTRPTSSCQKTSEQLNDPLIVNRKYDNQPRNSGNSFQPTINPHNERYPTIAPNDNLLSKAKRPLTCPKAFIHSNLHPSWEESPAYLPHVNESLKTSASQHFIENNYEYMQEYRQEYRDKTPRSLLRQLGSDTAFCSTMRELKKKECSVKNGTSSYHLRTALNHPGNDHNNREGGPRYDPYMSSTHTSREMHEKKMTRLFMPATKKMAHDKTFNRGYQHDSEFKNFSAFNGHLLRNKGSMLDR